MKPFRWAVDNNDLLKSERGVSFEEITVAVEAGALLEVVAHPNPQKYPRQRVMVVEVGSYAYLASSSRRPARPSCNACVPGPAPQSSKTSA